MFRKMSLNDLYQVLDQEFHPIVDYLVGLQVADRLSSSITKYEVIKLTQTYLVSIKKEDKSELAFHINYHVKKVDIEGFNVLLPEDMNRKVKATGLSINEGLTTYDYRSKSFYLSFLEILSYDDILKLKKATDNLI